MATKGLLAQGSGGGYELDPKVIDGKRIQPHFPFPVGRRLSGVDHVLASWHAAVIGADGDGPLPGRARGAAAGAGVCFPVRCEREKKE